MGEDKEIICKVLEFNDELVTLEFLIGTEYEERDFPTSPLFDDFLMYKGKFVAMIVNNTKNKMCIEMKEVDNLTAEGTFPTIDFYKEFKDLKLKK